MTLQDKQSLCQSPEDSALRSVHPLFIIKTINSTLPSGKEVETVSSVRTGIALTPKTGTTTDDLLRCKEKIAKALGVEADDRWVIVKPEFRDVVIEQDVLPEVAGAFGVSPETAYWANVREGCPTASVRLAFRAEGLRDSGRAHGRSSERQMGAKMRRGAGSAEIRTIGQPNTTPVEASSSVPTATASMQQIARRAQ
ncbi:hypothetical protein V8E54_001844 [Elaphomyces granulatus]